MSFVHYWGTQANGLARQTREGAAWLTALGDRDVRAPLQRSECVHACRGHGCVCMAAGVLAGWRALCAAASECAASPCALPSLAAAAGAATSRRAAASAPAARLSRGLSVGCAWRPSGGITRLPANFQTSPARCCSATARNNDCRPSPLPSSGLAVCRGPTAGLRAATATGSDGRPRGRDNQKIGIVVSPWQFARRARLALACPICGHPQFATNSPARPFGTLTQGHALPFVLTPSMRCPASVLLPPEIGRDAWTDKMRRRRLEEAPLRCPPLTRHARCRLPGRAPTCTIHLF